MAINLAAIPWGEFLSQTMFYLGYGLLVVAIIVIFFAAYYFTSFNYSMTYFDLFGSGKDGAYSFGKPRTNRVKWVKGRNSWRTMLPLFNKKDIEPFDAEYIYPGKKLFAFKLGDKYIPGRINVNYSENEMKAEINPVPYSQRNWEAITYQQLAKEYAQHNFWEDNKHFFMVVLTAAICCALVGFTVWWTLKTATGGETINAIKQHTSALQSFGSIPSR